MSNAGTVSAVKCPACSHVVAGLSIRAGTLQAQLAGDVALQITGYTCPGCGRKIHWGERR